MASNKEILKALCHDKPFSNYAKWFGYEEKEEDGIKTATFNKKVDFKQFVEIEPQIANEFISDFANKIVVQHVINLFEKKPLETKFGRFLKTYGKVGDIEQYITSKLQPTTDYDTDDAPTNPFEVAKPSVVLSYIKTTDKEMTFVSLNYEQWYGAFTTEGGLQNLANQILSNLNDALDMDIYYKICTDLGDATQILKSKTITTIKGSGEEANSKKAYEEIMELMANMELPSKTGAYNLGSLANSGTPKNKFVLFLNAKYSSAFKINVLASLFKSEKVDLSWEVIEFDTTAKDVVGVLMDERAYVYGYRINLVQSIMNPRNLYVNTFAHRWTKRGFIPMYNAVLLKTATTTGA